MNLFNRKNAGPAALVFYILTALSPAAHATELASHTPETGSTIILPASFSAPAVETIYLPLGDLFRPLLADPKEPHFYLSYRYYVYQSQSINTATGGFGEIFGINRYVDRIDGSAWQINFGGGIHAQFNLDMPSRALVNADYTIGFPVSYRKGPVSLRIALYHQSSHLGDEYLLQTKTNRMEFSYEALNVIGSHEWREWRVYGGGEYLLHKVPNELRPWAGQCGIEYYGTGPILGRGRIVGGLDLKIDQEHDWAVNGSLKAGLQFDSSESNGRFIRVLVEGYKGYSPHGQFYVNRISYGGIGIALGFD
jgi:hypothetical protein